MDEPRHHAHFLYFHPQTGWNPDPDGAILRIEAHTRVRSTVDVQNHLRKADGRGGWLPPMSDDSSLPAEQRGFVWFAWQTMAHGHPYLAFKGVRVVDKTVVEGALHGLAVYDEDGAQVADPLTIGHIFLLSLDDARVFHDRATGLGGQILRGAALPASALDAVSAIEKTSDGLEALSLQDARELEEARQANLSGRASFERRHEQARRLADQANASMRECERAVSSLLVPGKSLAERAEAEGVLARAKLALARSHALMERREADEREMGQLVAQAEGRLPDDLPASARLLYFRELGRFASDKGLSVDLTADGCRILTEHGWLTLPDFTFESG